MITEGMIEAFWRRFDAVLESRHYSTLKDYLKEHDLGVSYQGILWKRTNRIMPTVDTIITISRTLNISIDFLIFGYTKKGNPISDAELEILAKYRTANETTREIISSLLDTPNV